jgi:hypothetical protein
MKLTPGGSGVVLAVAAVGCFVVEVVVVDELTQTLIWNPLSVTVASLVNNIVSEHSKGSGEIVNA